MIYFDNIIFSLQRAGGISVVWWNLLKNIVDSKFKSYFIEYSNGCNNIFRQNIYIPEYRVIKKNYYPILTQLSNPKIEFDQKFIFHSSYFRICNNKNAINVTTVHDFIYEQGRPTLKQKLRMALNYKAIRKSDAIVCISENTKRDLFKFIPEINPEKVHVIYNGVSEDYSFITDIPYPEYRDYVVYVGGRQGYKNFDFVVKALSLTKYKLLICGSLLSPTETTLLEKYIPDKYKLIEYPSNFELNKIYNSVHCLAYPSSYEGFGLPILEAQRAGCPVIALASSSIPEIIGKEALLMSELSEKKFVSLITKIEKEDKRQAVVRAGLENSKRFSWEKMAKRYLKLYKSLLNT